MDRISVFARRQRIRNLEQWTLYAILTESFFLALYPTVAAAAVMFGVITWFLRKQIDSRYQMLSLPFDVPVALFLLIGAASVFLSSARSFELIYNYCTMVGTYGLTYLIVGQTIRTPAQVKQMAQALFVSAILVVLWGFFQFLFGIEIADVKWTDPEVFPELRKRVFSTLENPNVLAGYLDVFICLALGLLAKAERRSQKIILVGMIVMFAACLAMTYSRGAFLTLAIVFVIYGMIQDWRVLILFTILIGIIFYSDSTFSYRIISIFTDTLDSSEGLRIGIWVSTIPMIADHPFTGVGWGAFKFIYPQYNYYLADSSITIYHAHNLFLNTAAEVGIVGALAYFWYFFGTMFTALAPNSKNADDESKFQKLFNEQLIKTFSTSKFLQELAQAKAMLILRMADLSNKILDKFSPQKEQEPKKPAKKSEPELVHHEELKFSSKKKSKDDKKSDDDNFDVQKFADDSLFETETERLTSDKKFVEGLKFGIGLAFLSMALNGMSDDLLFNIPSSMLMWLLGALGVAITLIDDEN